MVIAWVHPWQYWVQQWKWLLMDKRNSHGKDNGNHVCINESHGRPKNPSPLKCRKWFVKDDLYVFHNHHKSNRIIKPLNPPQHQFIPIKSMIRCALQILFIQCRLLKNMNVIVKHRCVKIRVVISWLLQPNVMHRLY